MKRIFIAASALLAVFTFFAAGCAENNDITDVIPTVEMPSISPLGTTSVPENTQITITDPAASPTEIPTTGPMTTGGVIEGFSQGKVVDPEDVPEIVRAVQNKYEGASVQSITHTLHLDEQVYEVTFTSSDGQQMTVYVSADGTQVTESENPMATE